MAGAAKNGAMPTTKASLLAPKSLKTLRNTDEWIHQLDFLMQLLRQEPANLGGFPQHLHLGVFGSLCTKVLAGTARERGGQRKIY